MVLNKAKEIDTLLNRNQLHKLNAALVELDNMLRIKFGDIMQDSNKYKKLNGGVYYEESNN